MSQYRQRRLTWGGLLRILAKRPTKSYDHEFIKIVIEDTDGRWQTKYLNLKYDTQGRPYFIAIHN